MEGGGRETEARGVQQPSEHRSSSCRSASDTGWPRRSSRPVASEGGSHRPKEQPFVETAEAIALQIERDVAISGGLQFANDRRCCPGLERPRHFVARDLDARQIIVMTHTEHAKAER